MFRLAPIFQRITKVRHVSTFIQKGPFVDKTSRCIVIQLTSGELLRLPLAWLRDNCLCPQCFSSGAKMRRLTLLNFNPRIDVEKLEVLCEQADSGINADPDKSTKLKVQWSDTHTSVYDFRWLKRFLVSEKSRTRRETESKLVPQRYWNVHILNEMGGLPRFNFEAVITSNSALRQCLTKLHELGLCILEGAPLQFGQVEKLCQRISFVQPTHYGRTYTVETKDVGKNLAYTAEPLGLHTDLPYFFEPPGIQLLHCIKEASDKTGPAGLSLFADGFFCANALRTEQPDYYRILSQTKLQFKDHGNDAIGRFWLLHARPTIELESEDGDPKLTAINFNQGQRDVFFDCPLSEMQLFYDALHYFNKRLHDEDNCLQFKLRQGEVIIFHNRRMLHGRSAYRGERLLEGCYLGLDFVKSRLRVLLKDYERASEM